MPNSNPEHLRERREGRQRELRRRRLGAAVALLVVAGGIVAVVVGGGGGGNGSNGSAGRAADGKPGSSGKAKPASSLVRNAHPQPDWTAHTGPVPILAYHVLGPPIPGAPYPDLFVTRPKFRAQMSWLEGHGYQAVTLDQVQRAWYHGGTLPPKPVVLSFDDGYRPQYTFALPELRKHGWAGVLNLKAKGAAPCPDLCQSQVRTMIRAGWELAAHTINHLDLTTLDSTSLKHEVAGSRHILRAAYHVPVNNFCYPSGRFDSTAIAAVKAAGFTGATTEISGFASRDRPYELDRFEVLGSYDTSDLAGFLQSGGA
jgi:peptidoglycan/xylan/chitin deacetylase (PgdA/CDA1 family)